MFLRACYFSNETVSQTTVSTGPMKMFCLEHETMNVCQRNVACFVRMKCRFDKITTFFMVLEALKVNKFERNYRTGTQAAQALLVRSSY